MRLPWVSRKRYRKALRAAVKLERERDKYRELADKATLLVSQLESKHTALQEQAERAAIVMKHLESLADGRAKLLQEERAARQLSDKRLIEVVMRMAPPQPTPMVPVEHVPAEERALRAVTDETVQRMAQHFQQNDGMSPETALEHAKALALQAEALYS